MRKYFFVSFLIFTFSSIPVAACAEEGAKDQGKSNAKQTWTDVKQGSKEAWGEFTKGTTKAAKEAKKDSKQVWQSIKDVFN